MVLALWLACGGQPGPDAPVHDTAADCPDPSLTWENTGQPFVTTWCTPCHHSALEGESRFGAPIGTDYDTLDGVTQWIERIEARALGDDPTMPPVLPPSDEERGRFGTWLACGAPGQDIVDAQPCADVHDLAGDHAMSGLPTDFCDVYNGVAGDLRLDEDGSVDCLCRVDGEVLVEATVELPVLHTVGSLHASTAVSVVLPALVEVAGDLSLEGPVSQAEFALLERIEGDLHLTGVAAAEIDLPLLQHVGGDLVATGSDVLTILDLYRLQTIGGSLLLEDLPALSRVDPTNSLESIGGDVVLRNVGIERLDTLRVLEELDGALTVSECAELLYLRGLDLVVEVDALTVESNPQLWVLRGFDALGRVGGDVIIRDNPDLPASEVDALLQGVIVEGTVTTE